MIYRDVRGMITTGNLKDYKDFLGIEWTKRDLERRWDSHKLVREYNLGNFEDLTSYEFLMLFYIIYNINRSNMMRIGVDGIEIVDEFGDTTNVSYDVIRIEGNYLMIDYEYKHISKFVRYYINNVIENVMKDMIRENGVSEKYLKVEYWRYGSLVGLMTDHKMLTSIGEDSSKIKTLLIQETQRKLEEVRSDIVSNKIVSHRLGKDKLLQCIGGLSKRLMREFDIYDMTR